MSQGLHYSATMSSRGCSICICVCIIYIYIHAFMSCTCICTHINKYIIYIYTHISVDMVIADSTLTPWLISSRKKRVGWLERGFYLDRSGLLLEKGAGALQRASRAPQEWGRAATEPASQADVLLAASAAGVHNEPPGLHHAALLHLPPPAARLCGLGRGV